MATGIVSVAALLEGLPLFSDALLAVACAGWIVLAVVICLRLLRSRGGRPRLQSFAVVAATSVLGARFALAGRTNAALALWSLALLLWIALLVRRPVFAERVGGAMLAVVAVESLAVPAALVSRTRSADLVLFALAAWASASRSTRS